MVKAVLPQDGIGAAWAIARLNAADRPRRQSVPEMIASDSADGTRGFRSFPFQPQKPHHEISPWLKMDCRVVAQSGHLIVTIGSCCGARRSPPPHHRPEPRH